MHVSVTAASWLASQLWPDIFCRSWLTNAPLKDFWMNFSCACLLVQFDLDYFLMHWQGAFINNATRMNACHSDLIWLSTKWKETTSVFHLSECHSVWLWKMLKKWCLLIDLYLSFCEYVSNKILLCMSLSTYFDSALLDFYQVYC